MRNGKEKADSKKNGTKDIRKENYRKEDYREKDYCEEDYCKEDYNEEEDRKKEISFHFHVHTFFRLGRNSSAFLFAVFLLNETPIR